MNILLIGGGGREHALAWALTKSPQVETLYCAPGNAGIADLAICIALDCSDHNAVSAFCTAHGIGLVVIGPEAPLVDGLADHIIDKGIQCFGPSKSAARLEGSKSFTKDLCREHAIPTADYEKFDSAKPAKLYVRERSLPIVIKADGLAAGKGVVIATTRAEAEAAIDACFEGHFGEAGAEIVIEEFLEGEEASFFALVDGQHACPLATAQDHKRVGDGDTGPNTGGMGAYSPAPVMTPALCKSVMADIIEPTVKAMADRDSPFVGVLYAGLMITKNGPKLIEYNVRFGDPECQALMLRLETDLLDLLLATVTGKLNQQTIDWSPETAMTIVMAANGYPGEPEKGTEIKGLQTANTDERAVIFHAGTKKDGPRVLANGGRVLSVTALGTTIEDAQKKAYATVKKIDWPGGFYRTDIGWRAICRKPS